MSQLKHPWSEQTQNELYPGGRQGGSNSPRTVSAAPNLTSACYLPAFTKRAPWSSDIIHGGMTKEQIRSKRDCVVQHTIVSTRQMGTCTRFWTLLKGLFLCGKKKRAEKFGALTLPFIPHDRRKAYGYGAHPVVNRAVVRKSTFRCASSVRITTDDLWRSLCSTDDAPRVGSWPGGTTLHPLPYDWSGPQFPSLPSHNIRLNPYLQHHCGGPHPIAFDIARGPNKIMHNTRASSSSPTTTTPLDPVHLTQPATYPPVTHMHIQVVAEDPLPHFPWPIDVTNARGITCGNVFDAIAKKLLEHVLEEEYNTWTKHRKEAAARAYHQRMRTLVDPAGPDEVRDVRDGLRRIDYMGEGVVMIFHGLEQASATMDDTWFMFFGASERNEV